MRPLKRVFIAVTAISVVSTALFTAHCFNSFGTEHVSGAERHGEENAGNLAGEWYVQDAIFDATSVATDSELVADTEATADITEISKETTTTDAAARHNTTSKMGTSGYAEIAFDEKEEKKEKAKRDDTRSWIEDEDVDSSYEIDMMEVTETREYIPTIPLFCNGELGTDPFLVQDITEGLLSVPVRNYVELGEAGWQFIVTVTPCSERFNSEPGTLTHVDYFTNVMYFDNSAKSYSYLYRSVGLAIGAMNSYPQLSSEFQKIYEEEAEYYGISEEGNEGEFFSMIYEGLVLTPDATKRICPKASAFVSKYMK